MGRSNRDIYGPPRSSISYHPPSQYNSDSDLESPVFGPSDGSGNSSRYRYQDDANTLYAAVVAAQYQYPTSIYVAQGVATRPSEVRIQDAQVPSPTSATSGSEYSGELASSHSSFERNHPYFAMDPPDQSGSRLPTQLSHSAGMSVPEPFAEYSPQHTSYRANMPVGGSVTNEPSSSALHADLVVGGKSAATRIGRPVTTASDGRMNVYMTQHLAAGGQISGQGLASARAKSDLWTDPHPPPLKRKRKSGSSSSTGVDGDGSTTGSLSGSGDPSAAMKDSQKPATQVRKRSSVSSAGSAPYSQPRPIQPHPQPSTSTSAPLRIITEKYPQPSPQPRSSQSDTSHASYTFTPSPYITVKQQPNSPFLQAAPVVPMNGPHLKFPIPSTPAVESNQRTWWTLFLEQYPLSDVAADLSYLFSDTGHWLCFLNLPFFLDMLWNPEERLKIQPAFVLAGLAMAELMRSSDSERGASGRTRAAWLRDNAQTALTIAMSGGNGDWIDASLAEAALILVLYESSAHPQYHPDRVAASLRMLDQILKTISVSAIDAVDQHATRFKSNTVPVVTVPYRPHHYQRKCTCMPPGSPPPDTTQTWSVPLPWDPSWSAIEVRNEECRRLAWSALSLATSYLIQCVAFDREMPALELSNPANYTILFPGEIIDRVSPAYCSPNSPSPKESVWALYCRSLLLWNFCNHILSQSGPKADHQTEAEADALQECWNEAQAIQDSLEMHICNYETGVTYLCQEYVYNTRMSVTQALRKMQGLTREISTTPGPLFNPKQARQWIDYQARVIKRVKLATYQLGGPQGYQLTRRPFQVTWFLNQFSVCMQIWTHDTALVEAAELAKDFLAVVDVLNALWPCKYNQTQTDDLRKQLTQACAIVGTSPPLPATFATSLIRV
ncbi:Zn(2)-C6 fungal-type domain-containing protein [Mycena sanguinolenta]|uniref:Zn(2)-C6 fungal-type domain-containing protein n=1 Tax=Mycena sanguinolenta TaxID=230812 RepID=A0A8H6XMF6_9AGAR|nr:Zn(2)-C6 fungal-type domain-containing protein [Mycena sanguinolenta]